MVMKTYRDILKKKAGEGKPGYLLSVGWQYLRCGAGAFAGRPLSGPLLANLITNYSCNLRCGMCAAPAAGEEAGRSGARELSTEGILRVIDDLAGMGVRAIGFTGGEPLLRPDIFPLLRRAQERGVVASLNTNGLLLDGERVDALLGSGAESLNISLDGAGAATHDRIRGLAGSFDRTVEAVARVIAARGRAGGRPWVKLAAVLCPENLGEVDAYLRLGAELGVDSVNFLARQPFPEGPGKAASAGAAAMAGVAEAVERLRGPLPVPLEDSPRMLALLPIAFAGRPSPLRCFAGYNSITVDCFGRVFPCLPWAYWGGRRVDLGRATLAGLWRSREYAQLRREAKSCRSCTLNCHAELNLPLQPFRRLG